MYFVFTNNAKYIKACLSVIMTINMPYKAKLSKGKLSWLEKTFTVASLYTYITNRHHHRLTRKHLRLSEQLQNCKCFPP